MIAIEEFCQALNLEPLTQTTRKEMDINVTDLNRPGMQFCGFYEFFAAERPQVIGKVEMTYLESIEPTVREKVLRRYMSYDRFLLCGLGQVLGRPSTCSATK